MRPFQFPSSLFCLEIFLPRRGAPVQGFRKQLEPLIIKKFKHHLSDVTKYCNMWIYHKYDTLEKYFLLLPVLKYNSINRQKVFRAWVRLFLKFCFYHYRCHECNYAIMIEVPKDQLRVFTCLRCDYEYCRLCERPWKEDHFGKRCEEVDHDEKANKRHNMYVLN